MPCTPFTLPDGTRGIVCTAKEKRRRCSEPRCSSWAVRQCDCPVIRRGVARSCDRWLCRGHATPFGKAGDRDLCPGHKVAAIAARAAPRPAALRPAEDAQLYPVVLWRDLGVVGYFGRVGLAAARAAFLIAETPELGASCWEAQAGRTVLAIEVIGAKAKARPRKLAMAQQRLVR